MFGDPGPHGSVLIGLYLSGPGSGKIHWVADPDPQGSAVRNSALFWETESNLKFRSCRGSKWRHEGPWTLTIEAWRLKMEPWRGLKTSGRIFAFL